MSDYFDKYAAQKRVSLVAVDQILSTTINFVVLFSCLRLLDTTTFGSFSFVWGVISTFIVFSRAFFGTPVVLDNAEVDSSRSSINGSLIGALTLGILASLTILVLNEAHAPSREINWVLAVVLLSPLILFHDQLRFSSVAAAKPRVALLIDFALFTATAIAAVIMFMSKIVDFWLPALLLLGYSVSSIVGIRHLSISFDPKSLREIIARDLYRRGLLLADASLVLFFGILSLFILRQASGDEGVGLYSALALVFVPVTLVSVFMVFGLQKEVTRTRGNLLTRHKLYLLLLCLSPLAWGAALSVVPSEFILQVFGETVSKGLVFVAVYAASSSLFLLLEMLNLFLKSDSRFNDMVRVRTVSGILLVSLLLIGDLRNFSMTYLIGSFGVSSAIGLLITLSLLANRKIDGHDTLGS